MKHQSKIHLGSRQHVYAEEILYLQSDINYTKVFLISGRTLYTSTTLKVIENRIDSSLAFVRANRGTLINSTHVKDYDHEYLHMSNDVFIKVSRRRKELVGMMASG